MNIFVKIKKLIHSNIAILLILIACHSNDHPPTVDSSMHIEYKKNIDRITSGFNVDQILVKDVENLIKTEGFSQKYHILDIRSPQEYSVSHIQGAQLIDYENVKLDEINLDKNKTILVYCSVGYRSSKIGQKLKQIGYQVKNLYGGIFHWANTDLPMEDNDNQITYKIHPYSKDFEYLIKHKKNITQN